jgi:hypothetical protein
MVYEGSRGQTTDSNDIADEGAREKFTGHHGKSDAAQPQYVAYRHLIGGISSTQPLTNLHSTVEPFSDLFRFSVSSAFSSERLVSVNVTDVKHLPMEAELPVDLRSAESSITLCDRIGGTSNTKGLAPRFGSLV